MTQSNEQSFAPVKPKRKTTVRRTAELPRGESCTVVIFGASGDLARRKLIPALYNLACAGCTGNSFQILGVGRTALTDREFREQMREAVSTSKDARGFTEKGWRDFSKRLTYIIGDPNEDGVLEELAAYLDERLRNDESHSANLLFYLSVPPSVTPGIIEGLGKVGLTDESKGWRRVVIEKPFGRNLETAQSLNEITAGAFREEQVFRIDHYLGKETVQNIVVFRFGNTLFEPVWNRNYIDYVEITSAETLGVGTRGAFYEETGALRDMVANHLLQILTLVAMEPPVNFDAVSLREAKVQVLRAIQPMSASEVKSRTVRGQYATGVIKNGNSNNDGADKADEKAAGYVEEKGVAKDSQTETFAALEFNIENWRWAGVPFYIRAGKRLSHHETQVVVHFKRTPQSLFIKRRGQTNNNASDNKMSEPDAVEPNTVTLRIQPDEGISINFAAKIPGVEMRTGKVEMEFDYSETFGFASPAAYETLLLDAMQGDNTLFTRSDEIEAQWRLITPIEETWRNKKSQMPLATYAAGTSGPDAADRLLARHDHTWTPLTGHVEAHNDNEEMAAKKAKAK